MNRYNSTPIVSNPLGVKYYKNTKYPEIPYSSNDIYIVSSDGDRFDLLANQYYGDSTLWWIIAAANNNATKGALYPQPGTQLRIPTNVNSVLQQFDQFNKAR
jgi:hypothetical protein